MRSPAAASPAHAVSAEDYSDPPLGTRSSSYSSSSYSAALARPRRRSLFDLKRMDVIN